MKALSLCPLFLLFLFGTINSAVSQHQKVTEVPFFISQTGSLIIQATINKNATPTYFYIETQGRNKLRADQTDILETLSLDVEKKKLNDISITLGGTEFPNQSFIVRNNLHKRGELAFPQMVLGTIGPEFFKNKVVQLDFSTSKMRISKSIDTFHFSDSLLSVAFRSSPINPAIYLEMECWELGKHTLALDTRSPLGVHIYAEELTIFQRERHRRTKKTFSMKLNGEDELIFRSFMVPDIYLEHELTLKNQEVFFSNHLTSGIGVNFLKHYIVTIDFNANNLYFDPITDLGKSMLK